MARCFLLMFVAVLVFASLQIGDSLKCYHCASSPDGECKNPNSKNTSLIKECNATNPDEVCYIRNITLTSTTEIKRGCIPKNDCKSFQSPDGNTTCVTCEKDLCNSSPTVVVPSFFMFSFISAIIVKLYL